MKCTYCIFILQCFQFLPKTNGKYGDMALHTISKRFVLFPQYSVVQQCQWQRCFNNEAIQNSCFRFGQYIFITFNFIVLAYCPNLFLSQFPLCIDCLISDVGRWYPETSKYNVAIIRWRIIISNLKITAGLSVPLILPRRSINLSLGFQMNHDLPYNFSNFEPLYGRLNDDDNVDFDRKILYEYVIDIIESFGMNGEDCLLRSICEVSETPMHLDDDENLLEQILHFLLTPSKDFGNTFIKMNTSLEHKVLVAERLGRIHGGCPKIFDCPISLLDLFTNKFY